MQFVSGGPSSYGLPPDLIARASYRLGVAALVYSGVYFLAYGSVRVTHNMPGMGPLNDLLAGSFIALGLLMFALVRSGRFENHTLLDLGLIFQVIGAAGIEVSVLFVPDIDFTYVGLSWTCVWIVTFPLLVPATMGKAFLAALASASMLPLALLLRSAGGLAFPTTDQLIQMLVPGYICVGIAMVGLRVITNLGKDVSKARSLGSYHLVERLGQGGMGEVWRADHRLLARTAAVKFIRPEALGAQDAAGKDQLLRRFEREARATAQLTSPHTIALHDFGVSDEGVFYYVMELLRGIDLQTLVRRFGPLPAARATHLLRQICDSLAEAHENGLVHRDIKPANIFTCRLGLEFDQVKVLDFGLVKSSDTSGLTTQASPAGTPAFMAPEMVLGEPTVDGRADLYAVGCLAYWLLSGELVFSRSNVMQLAFDHVNTAPRPLSERTEMDVPAGIEAAIMACLEKDPANRPQSAPELRDLLDRTDGHEHWTREDARQWWAMHLPEFAD
jgi:serine/threonine-protein kinase